MVGLTGANIIGGASTKYNRSTADFYATPPDVTIALMRRHEWIGDVPIWEPACGAGDMSAVLIDLGRLGVVRSTDIRHTGYGRGGVDYLEETMPVRHDVVTNPPFTGAREFITKACGEARGVAMLVKQTYWNAATRLDLFRNDRPQYFHPLTWRPTMAPERGKSATMDFAWTVWTPEREAGCRFEPMEKPR